MDKQNTKFLHPAQCGQPELHLKRVPDPGYFGQRRYFFIWHCGGPTLRYKDVIYGRKGPIIRRVAVCPTCFAEHPICP